MHDDEPYISIQRWVYLSGPTPGQALRNLADYLDRAIADDEVNGLDDSIVPIMLCLDEGCEDGDADCYRVGMCVSWTPEWTNE